MCVFVCVCFYVWVCTIVMRMSLMCVMCVCLFYSTYDYQKFCWLCLCFFSIFCTMSEMYVYTILWYKCFPMCVHVCVCMYARLCVCLCMSELTKYSLIPRIYAKLAYFKPYSIPYIYIFLSVFTSTFIHSFKVKEEILFVDFIHLYMDRCS